MFVGPDPELAVFCKVQEDLWKLLHYLPSSGRELFIPYKWLITYNCGLLQVQLKIIYQNYPRLETT